MIKKFLVKFLWGQEIKNPSHFYSSNLFYKFIYIVLRKIMFTFQKKLEDNNDFFSWLCLSLGGGGVGTTNTFLHFSFQRMSKRKNIPF